MFSHRFTLHACTWCSALVEKRAACPREVDIFGQPHQYCPSALISFKFTVLSPLLNHRQLEGELTDIGYSQNQRMRSSFNR